MPPEPVSERTPQFRNIRFSNITAYTKAAVFINGLAEMPVEEVSLHDVYFEAETGISIRNAKRYPAAQKCVSMYKGEVRW